MSINKTSFGEIGETRIFKYTLENDNKMKVSLITYGGTLTNILLPKNGGGFSDVLLGFDTLEGYINGDGYIGATIGRVANRIGGGCFLLDGHVYNLAKNDGENTLHGGKCGFDKAIFEVASINDTNEPSITLRHFSKDGDENFPGNLTLDVSFSLTNQNEIVICYQATTDKKTIVNFTNHAYFNLTGRCDKDILDTNLKICSDFFTPVDNNLIPTGEFKRVDDTPFDFRIIKKIGDTINADDEQIKIGGGFDHNFILNGSGFRHIATAQQDNVTMEVFTDMPGVQFYSGNFLTGETGKCGQVMAKRCGFCLETQVFPDAINKQNCGFPNSVLDIGEVYKSATAYKFIF